MYKKDGIYYTSVQIKGKRVYECLRTKDKKVAKKREVSVRNRLYHEIVTNTYDKRKTPTSDKELVDIFLKTRKNLSHYTQRTYFYILTRVWLKKLPFPRNPSTQISYKKHINTFYRWSNENYKVNYTPYKLSEMKGRIRVYNKKELSLLFNLEDAMLVNLIKASYYTGARIGELMKIKSIHLNYIVVGGKSGQRIIKLSKQAQSLFESNLWDYHVRYAHPENEVQKIFRYYCKKLDIKDARFHDLRRTFGYNLIKKGMPIYQVSKLLGHKSVRTTERHYAPLLVTEVEDFEL